MIGRRNVLKALGAAPVAVPVALKEAATKMKLATLRPMPSHDWGFERLREAAEESTAEADLEHWAVRNLRAFRKGEHDEDIMRAAREAVCRGLDGDLASFRSVSPVWAQEKQVERTYRRMRARREKSFLQEVRQYVPEAVREFMT